MTLSQPSAVSHCLKWFCSTELILDICIMYYVLPVSQYFGPLRQSDLVGISFPFHFLFLFKQHDLFLRPYSLFGFIFLTPAQSLPHSPQAVSHSVTCTSFSTTVLLALLSLFPYSQHLFFSFLSPPCRPQFISSRGSFCVLFFFIHSFTLSNL